MDRFRTWIDKAEGLTIALLCKALMPGKNRQTEFPASDQLPSFAPGGWVFPLRFQSKNRFLAKIQWRIHAQ